MVEQKIAVFERSQLRYVPLESWVKNGRCITVTFKLSADVLLERVIHTIIIAFRAAVPLLPARLPECFVFLDPDDR
jgi:hypothetical protein